MTIPPGCCEMCRGRPAISFESTPRARQRRERSFASPSGSFAISSATASGSSFGDPREPFELGERQAERLAEVTDGPARSVGRETRDERGVLVPVALGELDDQLLADVAREVEVDVGHRVQLAVQEAAERETRGDRVDVRETRQVADERPDRAAPSPPGRQRMSRRFPSAHLARHLGRELEHLPMEEEESFEPQLMDQRELFIQPSPRLTK